MRLKRYLRRGSDTLTDCKGPHRDGCGVAALGHNHLQVRFHAALGAGGI